MGVKHNSFKKKLLASSISSCLLATASVGYAQEEPVLEEVIVTGIRASIQRSVDIKRDATGVVDAISAEDIGKFPDTNLAESLQRISGVSIDRANGEGSKITVRGFGADKNLITLNDRILPTTTGDRTFEFANVASEAVSSVEVYKTSDATVTSGGIGATVNLKTHRPLSAPGFKATVGGKMVFDDSANREDNVTPELSGLISNTFMEDKLGVSLVASYQERDSGLREFLQDQGYRAHEASFTDWGGAPAAPDGGVNRPTTGIYSVPQQPRYIFEDRQRERTNGQLVLQYEPIDTVTITADYTYVNNTYEIQHTDVSAWFNYSDDRSDSLWAGEPNAYPLIYSEIYPANDRDTSLTFGAYGSEEEIDSLGLNVEWQATDKLKLEIDYHASEGNLQATNPKHGTRNNLQMPSYTRGRTAMILGGGLPGIAIGADDLNNFEPDTFRLSGSWFQNHRYTSEVEQIQAKGNFEIDDSMSIDFGLSLDAVNNHFRFVSVERPDWAGVGPAAGAFSGLDWDEDTVIDKFQDSVGIPNNPITGEAVDTTGWAFLDRIYFADFDDIVEAAELADPDWNTTSGIPGDCQAVDGAAVRMVDDGNGNMIPDANNPGQFCPSTQYGLGTNRFTEEETTVLFAQYNYEGEIGDKPFDVHVGLRHEQTDVYSYASSAGYTGVEWSEATQAALVGSGDFVILEKSDDYSVTLPSLAFNLQPSDDFKVRLALGKTIARASYTDLLGGTSVNGAGNRSGFTGTSGNPGLKPLESTNIDFSVEWYYGDASYASIGAFRKDVKNWTSTTTIQDTVFETPLPNVFDGAKFDAAVASLGSGASNEAIREWIFDNYPADPYVERSTDPAAGPDDGVITGDPNTDSPVVFNIQVPANSSEKRTVSGLELNITHLFGDSGFGGQFNYTIVDSDISYDDTALVDTPALAGLSDTYNLVFFYDNYGLQARLAYNWRDEFLSERRVNADLTAGIYTEAYSQLDLNVSYEFPMVEGLSVFFEGINLTDEYVKTHGRNDALVYRITETGPRFNLGARYTF